MTNDGKLSSLLVVVSVLALWAVATEGSNITAILENFPEYSLYNSYMTQTKVADEVNSRETVTCLVLPNAAMSALAAKHSLAGIKTRYVSLSSSTTSTRRSCTTSLRVPPSPQPSTRPREKPPVTRDS
ncbi:hypothetical protein HPP92_021939 [Vanilla planifolia]|uniref:FAS1 domain-containing protein n=1 Tax=Vanilla planifolia TaxID=51239 RepID=A0A835PRB0_VANPL|nr:hypothetical protein HPP92_021939 [Vanilla planifolia]